MSVSIGMDTILCPVQNRVLQSINYGRVRKLFYKATCNPSHREQSLPQFQSKASSPVCILIQFTENLPHSNNTKKKWTDILEWRSILAAVTLLITSQQLRERKHQTFRWDPVTWDVLSWFKRIFSFLEENNFILLHPSPSFTTKACFVRITIIFRSRKYIGSTNGQHKIEQQ